MLKRLVFLLLFQALPATAQEVGISHELYELDNGLRIIVHEDDPIPIAAVNVWYHVGSGY